MKPQIVLVALISSVLAFLLCGLVADVVAAPADAGVALVAPFDAGPELAPAAGSGSAVVIPAAAPLPDPVAAPVESLGLLQLAWKGGGLPATLIVVLFFALTLARKYVAWLREGWRRLVVSALLGGLVILVERIAAGTTPTLGMVLGAMGAAIGLLTQAKGEPRAA